MSALVATHILALDQSLKRTGWAVLYQRRLGLPAVVKASGTFAVAMGKLATERQKVDSFHNQVEQLILDYAPLDALVWEKPTKHIGGRAGVTARTLVLTRLDETLVGLAHKHGLAHRAPMPATWRAKILGRGSGKLLRDEAKARALNYCRWIGVSVADDDEAEAVCIGLWAMTFGQLGAVA
jgi:hypothetical protein